MLSKSMYTSEYIQQLRDRTGVDPTDAFDVGCLQQGIIVARSRT